MNSQTAAGYATAQKLHPLSLLAQLISRRVSGHFRLSVDGVIWSLFLTQGRLAFATNTDGAFDRLDRHLRQLSADVPGLVSAVRVQLRLLFDQSSAGNETVSPDYRAICWLVEQDQLTPEQAGELIRSIAIEVLDPFLGVQEGHYELSEATDFTQCPQFCQLDLRPIVETCQKQRRQRLSPMPKAPAAVVGAAGRATTVNRSEVRIDRDAAGTSTSEFKGQTIPAYDPSLHFRPAARLHPLADRPTATEPAQKTTYTIACIDDSPTVLAAIQEFLDDKSLSVIPINDPVKALMQIMRSKPDLILLDVTMPNLDGYELCSLLRRHPRFRNTPIIMVTGNTGLIDRAKAKLVRASGYLTKPFSQSDLLKMVFMHLPDSR
ncbi:MAG: response regulator [Cyanobacteria bacterium J06648_16]